MYKDYLNRKIHTKYWYGLTKEEIEKRAKEVCRQLAGGGVVRYEFEITETNKGYKIESPYESVVELLD